MRVGRPGCAPNPSRGPVYLVVKLPEGMEGGTVRVMDPLGRVVVEKAFSGREQIIDLPNAAMATGFYTAGVFVDGIRLGTCKFEEIK